MDAVEKEKRKLTPDQARAWIGFYRSSVLLHAQLSEHQRELHDLDLDDYDILMHLWEVRPKGLRMSDLAARMVYSRSRICHRIHRLEDLGLAVRQRSSADGRGQVAVLSDEGYVRLRAAVRTKRADLQALLFEGLTEHEIHTLAEVFAKVRQRLDDRYEAVTP